MRAAVILSGGTGVRAGGNIPKQYLMVGGKSVISYCLDTFLEKVEGQEEFGALVITAAPEWRKEIEDYIASKGGSGIFKGFADPGKNRQLSIYNALLKLKGICADQDYVMIHDAARPLLKRSHIEECFAAASGRDGAMPFLPMKDTVYLSKDGKSITSLVKREEIVAGQAPEVFLYGKYLRANEALLPDKILSVKGSTEPAVLSGMDIALLPGDEGNYKLTTREDIERYKRSFADAQDDRGGAI